MCGRLERAVVRIDIAGFARLLEVNVVSALTRFRDVFAFGLLGVAVLYLIGGLSLLAKSEDDLGLGFTDRAAAFGYLFMHPLLIVALATAIGLAVGLGQPSRNAKPAVILALAIGGISFVVGLVSWFSAFGGEDVGPAALYGGVLGAGKVVAVFIGLAQLIALGLVLLFGFAAFQVLPKPAPKPQQWGAPQQYGWAQQQNWQQQGWQQPNDPGAWGAPSPHQPAQQPVPQQSWGQPGGQPQAQQSWGHPAQQPPAPQQQSWGAAPGAQQSWGQPPAQPGWGQPQATPQQSWGQPPAQPADQSWGQPAGGPSDQSWGQPAPEPGQHAWRPEEEASWSGAAGDDAGWAAPAEEQGWTVSGDESAAGEHDVEPGATADGETALDLPTTADDDLAYSDEASGDDAGSVDGVDGVDEGADEGEAADDETTDGQQTGWWQRPNG